MYAEEIRGELEFREGWRTLGSVPNPMNEMMMPLFYSKSKSLEAVAHSRRTRPFLVAYLAYYDDRYQVYALR